jgi:hypothetical protein
MTYKYQGDARMVYMIRRVIVCTQLSLQPKSMAVRHIPLRKKIQRFLLLGCFAAATTYLLDLVNWHDKISLASL